MRDPIQDPYAGGASPGGRAGRGRTRSALAVAALAAAIGAGAALLAPRLLAPAPSGGLVTRPTPSIITAVRDLARLETVEVHVEKVVDLTDRQSRFFGLIEATDAILLVAAGSVTLGVDLSKVRDGDIAFEPETGVARLLLPEPEIFSARLDEQGTYVYTRETSLLARRNEHLETRARKEAVGAIERAAVEADAPARARAQAERQLTALAKQLGATRVEIRWRSAGAAP
jgi:hypothetical protein